MSTNPYSHPVGPGNFGQDFLEPVQQRLSVLAVMALVFGCICFIPGSGAIAVILGGSAAIFISRSGGRLRGMGLAIAGIVLGLLFTMLWIFLVMGTNSAMRMFTGQMVKPADTFMIAMNTSDLKAARATLTPEADQALSDEMARAFAQSVQTELGLYKGIPNKGIIAFISAYGNVGPALQGLRGQPGMIPMPAEFDKGFAALVMEIDQNKPPTQSNGVPQFPMKNIGVVTNSGKKFWLLDPSASAIAPSRRGTPSDSTKPSTGDANKDTVTDDAEPANKKPGDPAAPKKP